MHYSLLEDAVACFLESFTTYESLRLSPTTCGDFPRLSRCIRDLYISLEKGFKHAISKREPYLVLKTIDRNQIKNFYQEKMAKGLPSIFCGTSHFETISMEECWKSICDLKIVLDTGNIDIAIRNLAKMRHLAQHAELYVDPSSVLATAEQIFSYADKILGVEPMWLEALKRIEPSIESRLAAVRGKVDGAWQLLIEHLRKNGPLVVKFDGYVIRSPEVNELYALFGGATSPSLTIEGTAEGQGLFSRYLTDLKIRNRHEQRDLLRDTALEPEHGKLQKMLVNSISGTSKSSKAFIAVLEAGGISMAGSPAFISFDSTYAASRIEDLVINFPDAKSSSGQMHGYLHSRHQLGGNPPRAKFDGEAKLEYEYENTSESLLTSSRIGPPPHTVWNLECTVSLEIDPVEVSTTGSSDKPRFGAT